MKSLKLFYLSVLCLALLTGCGKSDAVTLPDTTETNPVVDDNASADQEEPAQDGQDTAEPDTDTDTDADDDADEDDDTGSAASNALPFDEPMELVFASGAGAWGTSLTLSPDGSFTGGYSDSDMGDSDTAYPNGTRYLCDFKGTFGHFKQVDESTWTLFLDTLSIDVTPGTEWIEDDIRYVASDPAGLTNENGQSQGVEFTLYLPDTRLDSLPEEFLTWWANYGSYREGNWDSANLDCYALRNTATEDGFFAY